jgi:hypothetical protein
MFNLYSGFMMTNTTIIDIEDVMLEVTFEYDPLDLSFFSFSADINLLSVKHKKECILVLLDGRVLEEIERKLFNTVIKYDTTYTEY